MSSTPTRTRRTPAAATGRFTRTSSTQRPRTSTRRPAVRRSATPQRRGVAGGWLQRSRPPKQSGLKRALSGAAGAIPGLSKSRPGSSGRGGKAGGLALLAGAAGLVFKNRDKVASMVRRDDSGHEEIQPATPVVPAPMTSGTGPADANDAPKL